MSRVIPVYAIFVAFGDGDGYRVFDLLSLASSVEEAKEYIAQNHENEDIEVNYMGLGTADSSMTKENNYTFIGKRGDCDEYLLGYKNFGGYVIEEMSLVLPSLKKPEVTENRIMNVNEAVEDITRDVIDPQIRDFLISSEKDRGVKGITPVYERWLGLDLNKFLPNGLSRELEYCYVETILNHYKHNGSNFEVRYASSENEYMGNLLFIFENIQPVCIGACGPSTYP